MAIGLLLFGQSAANAALAPVAGGALVSDSSQNLTWISDGNLFLTQLNQSGDPSTLVGAIVSSANGMFSNYTVSAGDFVTTGANAGMMDWWAAQAWVHYLGVTSYLGYSDWRLPRTVNSPSSIGFPDGGPGNPSVSSSEMAGLFYGELGQVAGTSLGGSPGPFTNVQASDTSSYYWSTLFNPYNAFLFSPANGYQSNSFNLNGVAYAWAVRDGQVVASVPEPSTYALMLGSLCGVALVLGRRRPT
jgi:hypothetical protein